MTTQAELAQLLRELRTQAEKVHEEVSRLTRVIRDVDVTRPTTPSGFGVNPISATQINLLWTASTDPQGATNEANTGVAGYRVYRNGSLRTTTTSLSFSDTGLTEYTLYSYSVTAIDGATTPNESVPTAVLSPRTFDVTAPTAPVITAATVSSSALSVALTTASTDSGSGVSTYRLEYKRSVDSTWTLDSASLTSGSFPRSISGLTASTAYDTRCRATDAAGNVGNFSATSSATTQSAGGSQTLQVADWNARRVGPGVVWYHGIESDNEANAFRWVGGYLGGNDPQALSPTGSRCRRITTDGSDKGGGTPSCIEIVRPAGTENGPQWWRPFSPIVGGTTTGNGRGVDDPGANGTITPRAWNVSNGSNTMQTFGENGFYGTSQSGGPHTYDGTDWYFQVRVKMDPRRVDPANLDGNGIPGKLFIFTRNDASFTSQKIVVYSAQPVSGQNYFGMYSGDASLAMDQQSPGVSVHGNQPNTQYGSVGDGLCRLDNNGGRLANCWHYPNPAEWVTFLYHVRNGDPGSPNSIIEIWVAEDGDLQYTKIWEQNWTIDAFGGFPNGQNAMDLSTYMNTGNLGTEIYIRYDQLIFSKSFIPCPAAYSGTATTLAAACHGLSSGQSVSFTTQSSFGQAQLEWQTEFFHDERHGLVHLVGKAANEPTGWKHEIYDVLTNTWTDVTSSSGLTAWNYPGHIYGNFSMDYETGDVYLGHGENHSTGDARRTGWWQYDRDYTSVQWDWAPANVANNYVGALESHPNGTAYHPNLYGPNSGGLVIEHRQRLLFWRKSNDLVQTQAHSQGLYGDQEEGAMYWPAQDCVIAGRGPFAKVVANSTAGGNPVVTTLPAAPIAFGGHSWSNHGSAFGTLVVHPGNHNKLLLIEQSNGSANGQRAWTSTDGSNWTQIGNHPATFPARVQCSLRAGLGCIWFIGKTGGTEHSVLWRPPP